jgi:phasin family protein
MLHMESQLSRVAALNKTGLDVWLEAAQILADSTEKFGRLQFETIKSVLRDGAQRGRGLGELRNFTELQAQVGSEAAATGERVLGYTRTVYDTAQETGAQLFALTEQKSAELRSGWFAAVNELSDASPGGKTGGTKAALDTTLATVEAVVQGFTRTAKQSFDMTDAVLKTASDATAQAIRSIGASG